MAKIHRSSENALAFHCPGCGCGHRINIAGEHPRWEWNGSVNAPTFMPSIKVSNGHFADGHKGECWCTYNASHPEQPAPFSCSVCHSYVSDGKIRFLADSTHKLAGQTVEIPEWES